MMGFHIVWFCADFTELNEYTVYRCVLFRLCVFLLKF